MPSPSTPSLRRQIGLWGAVAIVIGSTIGSGIFRSPAGIAARLPGPGPLLAVFLVAGVLALCGALVLAELGSAHPRTGGIYVYLQEAWGPWPAFLFGWTEFTVIRAASMGAISVTCAEYALRVAGLDPAQPPHDTWARLLAALAIAFGAGINIAGVRPAIRLQGITTAAKYGGLLAIVAVSLFIALPRTGGHFTPVAPPGSFGWGAFGLALISALWVFDGWADVSFIGGEVEEPRRNLPRALVLGTLLVLGIYLAALAAYLSVLDIREMAQSRLVAADVMRRTTGEAGALLVGVLVVVSTLGTLLASLLTSPRIFVAMAADGTFFPFLGRIHPVRQTPQMAILCCATLGIGFVLMRSFEQLTDAFVTAIVPFYALAVAGVYRLRQRPGYHPPFRAPGGWLAPGLFLGGSILLLGNAVIDPSSRWPTLAVLGVSLAGIPVRRLFRAGSSPGRQPA